MVSYSDKRFEVETWDVKITYSTAELYYQARPKPVTLIKLMVYSQSCYAMLTLLARTKVSLHLTVRVIGWSQESHISSHVTNSQESDWSGGSPVKPKRRRYIWNSDSRGTGRCRTDSGAATPLSLGRNTHFLLLLHISKLSINGISRSLQRQFHLRRLGDLVIRRWLNDIVIKSLHVEQLNVFSVAPCHLELIE